MVDVGLTSFLSESRDFANLSRRIGTVASRFGITAGKFEKLLKAYEATTRELGCTPSFPVTAVILRRHARTFRELSRSGVELAVHGYVHINYASCSPEEQAIDFEKARGVFKRCGIPFAGFRAPFLRFNNDTLKVLGKMPFAYDSSTSICWDVLDRSALSEHGLALYDRLLSFYGSSSAEKVLALPYFTEGIAEIPVSLPDDEAMIERLGITSQDGIAKPGSAYCNGRMPGETCSRFNSIRRGYWNARMPSPGWCTRPGSSVQQCGLPPLARLRGGGKKGPDSPSRHRPVPRPVRELPCTGELLFQGNRPGQELPSAGAGEGLA